MIWVFISIIPSVLYGIQLHYFTLRKLSFSLCICRTLFVSILQTISVLQNNTKLIFLKQLICVLATAHVFIQSLYICS